MLIEAGYDVTDWEQKVCYKGWSDTLKQRVMMTIGTKQWTNSTNVVRLACMPESFLIKAAVADKLHQQCKYTVPVSCCACVAH